MNPTSRPPPIISWFRSRFGIAGAVLAGWETLFWGLAAFGAGFVVLVRYELGQNSDGLLQTLISVQHLTLFFWGQDRFANLLPWLASPVGDPVGNAWLQLGLRVAAGVGAPLLFCAAGSARRNAGRATLLATSLALAFAPARFIHEWFIEANPYGTSFLLAGWALLLLAAAPTARRGAATALRTAALLLTVAAYAVNASLVLIAAPLFVIQLVLSGAALAGEFAIASVVALVAVTLAVVIVAVGGPATSLRFGETTMGLAHFTELLLHKSGLFPASMAAMFLLAVVVGRTREHRGDRPFVLDGVALLVTFGIGFMAISLSSWVVLNYFHPRYLVPLYVLAAALGSISMLRLIDLLSPKRVIRRSASLILCVVLLGIAGRRGLAPVPPDDGIVAVATRPLATEVATAVTRLRLDGVAGDYWTVWPSVFLAEQLARTLGRPGGAIFGITLRGTARRDALRARLLANGSLRIACIDLIAAECGDEVAVILGSARVTVEPVPDQPVTIDGPRVGIIQVRP